MLIVSDALIKRKRSWNRAVAYPICWSVRLSVCPESVLWQNTWLDNAWLDPDAVWDGGGVGREIGVLDWGGDRRRGRCSLRVNLGHPIATNGMLLRNCARATRSSQITLGRTCSSSKCSSSSSCCCCCCCFNVFLLIPSTFCYIV